EVDALGREEKRPIGKATMTYRAPVADISFALNHAADFATALADGLYGDLGDDVVEAVLTEAGKFATDILAPLNVIGDREGARFHDGAVTTPPGWKEAYHAWAEGGWNALCAPEPSVRRTAATASPDKKSSSLMASTISPRTSSMWCWRGSPTRPLARRAFRSS